MHRKRLIGGGGLKTCNIIVTANNCTVYINSILGAVSTTKTTRTIQVVEGESITWSASPASGYSIFSNSSGTFIASSGYRLTVTADLITYNQYNSSWEPYAKFLKNANNGTAVTFNYGITVTLKSTGNTVLSNVGTMKGSYVEIYDSGESYSRTVNNSFSSENSMGRMIGPYNSVTQIKDFDLTFSITSNKIGLQVTTKTLKLSSLVNPFYGN